MGEYVEGLVSILTPAYKCAETIGETIRSVQGQTYRQWEMLIVDDASPDGTAAAVEAFQRADPRIRLLRHEQNKRAAGARNTALAAARGQYIAYLDADDLWYPEKLAVQIEEMRKAQAAFSCTSFEVIDEKGVPVGRSVRMKPSLTYHGFLQNNLLQTVGIMADVSRVPKELLRMPELKLCEDAATWLQVLKAGYPCLGVQPVLAQYRHAAGSLSGNKKEAAKAVWHLYRRVEKLPLPYCCWCYGRYLALGVWKHIRSLRQVILGSRGRKA